jgi:hypothetical protein
MREPRLFLVVVRSYVVVPAKAGTQIFKELGPRLRGGDDLDVVPAKAGTQVF